MSMRETRKKRRKSSRAALRTVAAAPSFKAVKKKRSSSPKFRRGLIVAAFAGALVALMAGRRWPGPTSAPSPRSTRARWPAP